MCRKFLDQLFDTKGRNFKLSLKNFDFLTSKEKWVTKKSRCCDEIVETSVKMKNSELKKIFEILW